MTRLLVTGASGFIGRHVLGAAHNHFDEVHAISSKEQGLDSGVVWHRADLLRPGQSRAVVEAIRPTHLLHLAWNVTPGTYWTSHSNLDWLSATLELARNFAASGGQRMVGAGTCAEYEWGGGVLSEAKTPEHPFTLYGASKLAAFQAVDAFCRQEGLSFAWGRIFFTYGPHEHPDRLVSSIARSLLSGTAAECTAGTQLRDFLYVEDLARAFVALAASQVNGPVNLGSGQAVPVREVATALGKLCARPDLVRLGARPLAAHEPQCIVADIGRLGDELGFSPEVQLEAGLERTVSFWRQALRLEVSL